MDKGNKEIVLIANIGNRDVWLDDKRFEEIEQENADHSMKDRALYVRNRGREHLSPRFGGKFISENFDSYKDRLSMPMIEKALREVFLREKGKIDRILLMYTDQQDERYLATDTLYFAEIIKKLLVYKYKDDGKKGKRAAGEKINVVSEDRVVLVKVDGELNDSGKMYKKFKEIFDAGIYMKQNEEDIRAIYVSPIGGMPTINTALVVSATLCYPRVVQLLKQDEYGGEARSVSFARDLINDMDKKKVADAFNRYDYVTAVQLIQSNQQLAEELKEHKLLMEMSKNRLYFNFDEARRLYKKYIAERDIKDQEVAEMIESFYGELCILKDDMMAKIKELYVNARIKYIQEQYVDCLLRVFRLQESLYRYALEDYLDLCADKENRNGIRESYKKLEDNPDFRQYIEKVDCHLDWSYKEALNTNNRVFRRILKYVISTDKNPNGNRMIDESNKLILKKIDRFGDYSEGLSELRNKSIAAHGFTGISDAEILDCLKESGDKIDGVKDMNVEKYFQIVEDVIEMKFEDNIYKKINELLIMKIS